MTYKWLISRFRTYKWLIIWFISPEIIKSRPFAGEKTVCRWKTLFAGEKPVCRWGRAFRRFLWFCCFGWVCSTILNSLTVRASRLERIEIVDGFFNNTTTIFAFSLLMLGSYTAEACLTFKSKSLCKYVFHFALSLSLSAYWRRKHTHIYIYIYTIYIFIHIHIHEYIYICIARQREREREREGGK